MDDINYRVLQAKWSEFRVLLVGTCFGVFIESDESFACMVYRYAVYVVKVNFLFILSAFTAADFKNTCIAIFTYKLYWTS